MATLETKTESKATDRPAALHPQKEKPPPVTLSPALKGDGTQRGGFARRACGWRGGRVVLRLGVGARGRPSVTKVIRATSARETASRAWNQIPEALGPQAVPIDAGPRSDATIFGGVASNWGAVVHVTNKTLDTLRVFGAWLMIPHIDWTRERRIGHSVRRRVHGAIWHAVCGSGWDRVCAVCGDIAGGGGVALGCVALGCVATFAFGRATHDQQND